MQTAAMNAALPEAPAAAASPKRHRPTPPELEVVQPGSARGSVMIHVAERMTVRSDSARQIIFGMVLPQALLIIAATVAVWYGVGRGLRPLASLRGEVESRSHRDLSPLPETRAPLELQPLIHAMNGLLGRLSAVLAAQQRFIADAAHQLRTPLASAHISLSRWRPAQAKPTFTCGRSSSFPAGTDFRNSSS